MSAVGFYFDEHIGDAIARGLRQRGIDVMTVVEAGMLGARDEEHVALARRENRVIVTHDADFLRLAARGVDHAGVVYAPQGMTIGAMVRSLTLISKVMTADEMRGHIEYL